MNVGVFWIEIAVGLWLLLIVIGLLVSVLIGVHIGRLGVGVARRMGMLLLRTQMVAIIPGLAQLLMMVVGLATDTYRPMAIWEIVGTFAFVTFLTGLAFFVPALLAATFTRPAKPQRGFEVKSVPVGEVPSSGEVSE